MLASLFMSFVLDVFDPVFDRIEGGVTDVWRWATREGHYLVTKFHPDGTLDYYVVVWAPR
jgi:hypothetical protein